MGSQQGSCKYLIQMWVQFLFPQSELSRSKGGLHCPAQPTAGGLSPAPHKVQEDNWGFVFQKQSLRFSQDWFISAGKGKTLSSQHWSQKEAYLGSPSLQTCSLNREGWEHSSMGCLDAPTSGASKSWRGCKAPLKWGQYWIARKRKEMGAWASRKHSCLLLAVSQEASSCCVGTMPAAIDRENFNQKYISYKDCFGGQREKATCNLLCIAEQ